MISEAVRQGHLRRHAAVRREERRAMRTAAPGTWMQRKAERMASAYGRPRASVWLMFMGGMQRRVVPRIMPGVQALPHSPAERSQDPGPAGRISRLLARVKQKFTGRVKK